MCGVVIAMTCSCEFRQERGTMPPDKKQAAVGVGSAVRLNNRLAKEPCMSSIQLTMSMAWLQYVYVSCYVFLSCFCCIIEGVTTTYKTTPQGADNTEQGLTNVPMKEARHG